MKKIFYTLLVTVLVLCSCTKHEYLNAIPADAVVVASVDVPALFEKSDFAESGAMKQVTRYMNFFVSKKEKGSILDYMDSPETIGIDFRSRAYVFKTKDGGMGLSLKVSDEDELEEFFDMFERIHVATKPAWRDDVCSGTILGSVAYAFTDDALLLLMADARSATALKQRAVSMLMQKREESFVATEMFKKLDDDDDVCVFSTLAAFKETFGSLTHVLVQPGVKHSDVQVLSTLNFVDGRISMRSQTFGATEKAQKMLETNAGHTRSITGRYVDAPMSDFVVWAGAGVEGKWLLGELKKIKEANEALFMLGRAIDVDMMLSAVDGDVAITIPSSSVAVDDIEDVDFILTADVKNTDFLSDVDYWTRSMTDYGMSMRKAGEGQYVLSADDIRMHWGTDKDMLWFATERAYMANSKASRSKELLPYKDEITKCRLFVYVSANGLVTFAGMKPSAAPLFRSLILKSKTATDLELDVEFTDDSQNALKSLLSAI